MPQTTKLIREQIQQKRQKRQKRNGRIRSSLILLTALAVLILLPLLLISGSVGVTLFGSLQSVPAYQTAADQFQAQNRLQPTQFVGRDSNGESVELFETTQPVLQNGDWIAPDELTGTTLNLVYAQWPDLFLADAENDQRIIARSFVSNPNSAERLAPDHTAAAFMHGAPFNSTFLGRLEANLIKSQLRATWEIDELAAWHLNHSYFGNQLFGIQAAARFYFSRDASQLTLPEAAMLVGIPRNPAVNPIDDPAGAKLQQEAMLEAVLRANLISQEQFIAARFTPLDINTGGFTDRQDTVLERFLHSRLAQYFSPAEIGTNRLSIITTIDPDLQQTLHCLTDFYLNYLNNQGLVGDGECPEAVNLAGSELFPTGRFNRADSVMALVLDPQTGQIIAFSGAGEVANSPSGNPQQPAGNREIGGLFYPFVYLTALSQGHTLSSMVLDITNAESNAGDGLGPIFLEEALLSGSPAAVDHVLGWTGVGAAFKTIAEMGGEISMVENSIGYQPRGSDAQLGFVDLAHAYGVMANRGTRVGSLPFGRTQQSIIIGQVENERGDILHEASLPVERAILPDELTWLINQTLNGHTLPTGQAAVKVTASGQQNQDEWTVGYTPNLVVAVWAGNLATSGERATGAEPVTPALWQTIMLKAGKTRPPQTWPPPDNIVSLDVCWPSGLQPNGLCPTRQGLFVAGTEPVLFDTMYQEFLINSENGNLATSSTPSNRVTPITVQTFPPEAQGWAIANGFPQPPTTYDSIRTESTTAGFEITAPAAFADVKQQIAIQIVLTELNRFDYFRIAAYQGLSPGALQVVTERIEPKRNLLNLDIPLTLPFQNDGLYTLLITGFRSDGSIEELPIPINVTVNE